MATTTPISEETIRPEDGRTVPWEDAAKRLAEAGTFWLATVRPDGHPHVRPVLVVWADDGLHVAMSTSSRKSVHLSRSPGISVAAETPGLDLVVEGEVIRVTDDARLRRVADVYESKYGWHVEIRDGAFWAEGAPTAGPPPFHVCEIRPVTAYGFGTDDSHAPRSTRWRFRPHGYAGPLEMSEDAPQPD